MFDFTVTPFESLVGKTLRSVTNIDDVKIEFVTNDGEVFHLFHIQYCSEAVSVESIVGDLDDLVGSVILAAEEVNGKCGEAEDGSGTFTYTFYKMATFKGYVDIRWYGESNGCYSESVTFAKIG